jgi:putative DNA primase/helicase
LLIDGEMPAAALRDRLASIVAGSEVEAAPGMLRLLVGDLIEEGGIGNIANSKVQSELDKCLDSVELLILDNLSSLATVVRDNDQESWESLQAWLLRLRRRGISVLIVHHAGKGGDQRGTSRKTCSTPRYRCAAPTTTVLMKAHGSRCILKRDAVHSRR